MSFSLIFHSALTQALLESLWQDALLGLFAALLLGAVGRRSAALKHAVGMVFLLAMAVLPIVTLLSLLSAGSVSASTGVTSFAPQGDSLFEMMSPGEHLIAAPAWLPWLWFSGVVVMLMRLIGGGLMVRRLNRQSFTPLAPAWQARVDVLRHAMGIRREVAVRLLQGVGLPCSARAWRPVIWMPIAMLTQLAPDQIEALLAHELAHVRRLDWIWNGAQRVIEALLFYHPAVWWLSRRIRQERENACDDLAVAACGDAIVLAEALANLEKLRTSAHIFALSADGGSLMQRVTRLISPHTPTRLGWNVPVAMLAVLFSGALVAAQAAPSVNHALAGTTPTAVASKSTIENSFGTNGLFLGGWRAYSESVLPRGHVIESYTVNGHPAPIDAGAREWIASRHAAASEVLTPPATPSPPAMPTPPPIPSLSNQTMHHWWQIASNSFEISAPFAGGQRVYKTSTSMSGQLRESYTVNGRPTPIDASVRQWIEDQQAEAAKLAQIPPMPAVPPVPPMPPKPAMPPRPGTSS
jgi:beta-lactamase regulating signal transducer with metallopeptidase domain